MSTTPPERHDHGSCESGGCIAVKHIRPEVSHRRIVTEMSLLRTSGCGYRFRIINVSIGMEAEQGR